MYLTSTDGFCSAGHRPERSLAAYGAYLRAMPWSNEQGLRMLIGAAVQASTLRQGRNLFIFHALAPWSDGQCLRKYTPEGTLFHALVLGSIRALVSFPPMVQAGAARGVVLTPVFSLYSYHGPVFRVMLRARRSAEWRHEHYGFAGHCHVHGDTRRVDWRHLSSAVCT